MPTETRMPDVDFVGGQELAWTPHPDFRDVRLAWLARRFLRGASLSCALVDIPDGAAVPEHVHREDDDILYVLRGGASLWIDGVGETPLTAGDFLRVPCGVRHRPHGFAGGFRAFNVWAPNPA